LKRPDATRVQLSILKLAMTTDNVESSFAPAIQESDYEHQSLTTQPTSDAEESVSVTIHQMPQDVKTNSRHNITDNKNVVNVVCELDEHIKTELTRSMIMMPIHTTLCFMIIAVMLGVACSWNRTATYLAMVFLFFVVCINQLWPLAYKLSELSGRMVIYYSASCIIMSGMYLYLVQSANVHKMC
jgi:hypothetical protein